MATVLELLTEKVAVRQRQYDRLHALPDNLLTPQELDDLLVLLLDAELELTRHVAGSAQIDHKALDAIMGEVHGHNKQAMVSQLGVGGDSPLLERDFMNDTTNQVGFTETDHILTAYHSRVQAAYGQGASAIPWQAILAAIAALFGQICPNPTPTPPQVRAAFGRPVFLLRLHRRLLLAGVPSNCVNRVIAAHETMVKDSTDSELVLFVKAAQESE